MIRPRTSITPETRENLRGGRGRAEFLTYLGAGDMAGIDFMSVVTLEPGTTIGTHPHLDSEELYYIVNGRGEGSLDDERFPVGAGDAWVCKAGHCHALACAPDAPLTFLAIITPAAVSQG